MLDVTAFVDRLVELRDMTASTSAQRDIGRVVAMCGAGRADRARARGGGSESGRLRQGAHGGNRDVRGRRSVAVGDREGVPGQVAERAGIQMVRAATVGVTRHYAGAATAAVGSGASALSVEAIRRKIQRRAHRGEGGHGRGKAHARRATRRLSREGEGAGTLQKDIDYTRSLMKGCHRVEIMPEVGLGTIYIPTEADWDSPRL